MQGVGFRWWAVGEAERLGLRGWVRNRRDGSVDLLAIGTDEAVDGLADALKEGPPGARVRSLSRREAQDDGSPGFTQRDTV